MHKHAPLSCYISPPQSQEAGVTQHSTSAATTEWGRDAGPTAPAIAAAMAPAVAPPPSATHVSSDCIGPCSPGVRQPFKLAA